MRLALLSQEPSNRDGCAAHLEALDAGLLPLVEELEVGQPLRLAGGRHAGLAPTKPLCKEASTHGETNVRLSLAVFRGQRCSPDLLC